MAKRKFNLSNIQLPDAKPVKKSNNSETDAAVDKIHKKKMGRPKREEAVTRLTVDLPKSVHKQLKLRAIDEETTLRNLVINILMEQVEK